MRIFPHLFAKLFCSPLMISGNARFSLEFALLRRMGVGGVEGNHPPFPAPIARDFGQPIPDGPDENYIRYQKQNAATDAAMRIESIYSVYGSVAVVKLDGVIDKHISQMDAECYGGCDLDDFNAALSIAAADPKIETVVLAINSPGGSVTGVPESAARVAALAQTKEVRAYVDGMACSAAYYIASQADLISCAPSACLGSIGVYMTLLDETRAAEMEGIKVEMITAGKFKAMGSPFKPLSDEERQMFQAQVDGIRDDFRAAVRAGRRQATEPGGHQTVLDSTMEGQSFDGKQSIALRLADELTSATLDEYVSALL
jgi:protease-4